MFKQNNPVTIYCLALGVFLAILGPLAQNGQCDFTLTGNQEITVNSTHYNGTLHDTSSAFIVSGGNINWLRVHDHSTMNMSAGHVNTLYSYEYSTMNISGGDFITGEYPINSFYAYMDSTVNISGGSIGSLTSYDSSRVNFSDGYATYLTANNSSYVDISGGTLNSVQALESVTMNISGGSVSESLSTAVYSTVNISGGSVGSLHSADSSTVIFYGQSFNLGSGLDLVGERVLGTGILSGQWIDGTPWSVDIKLNSSSATILLTPEPATLLLFGLGAAFIKKRKIQKQKL